MRVNIDEAITLINKQKDGAELNDIEKQKVTHVLTEINKELENYERELTEFRNTLDRITKGRSDLAVMGCVDYAINFITGKLNLSDEDDFKLLGEVYQTIKEEILTKAVVNVTREVKDK